MTTVWSRELRGIIAFICHFSDGTMGYTFFKLTSQADAHVAHWSFELITLDWLRAPHGGSRPTCYPHTGRMRVAALTSEGGGVALR